MSIFSPTSKKSFTFIFCCAMFSVLVSHSVFAAKTINDAEGFLGETVRETGLPTATVETSTATIIQGALGVVGIAFFVLMVYGGFLWMVDRGNDEQAKKARDIIQAAVIGMVLIVAAYALSSYIFGRLNS